MSCSAANADGIRSGRVHLKNGVELHYAESGAGGRQVSLLLHGYADSWQSFKRIITALQKGRRLIAPDLRGHGESDKPAGPYTLEVFARDVLELMDALGVESANLIGHSMGSLIAQCLAARAPHRVERLALIGSAAQTAGNAVLAQIKPRIDSLSDPVDRDFVVEFQTPANPVPEAFMQVIVSESLKVPAHVWKGVFSGLLHIDNRQSLHQITAPTLILWGNQDPIFTRKDQDDLLQGIPDAKLVEYPAGHGLHWEKPEEVSGALERFLGQA